MQIIARKDKFLMNKTGWPSKLLMWLILAMLLISAGPFASCSKRSPRVEPPLAPKSAPTSTSTATPEAKPVATSNASPSGWAKHVAGNATQEFEIAVPSDWITLELSPESIDAMIEKMGPSNPKIVPALQALKNQQVLKFWAADMSDLSFPSNVTVGSTIRLIPLDQLEALVKKQLEPLGYTNFRSESLNIRSDKALKLQFEGTFHYPGGAAYHVLQSEVIVEHRGYQFFITITYPPDSSDKYEAIFDTMLQSFSVTR